MVSISQGIAARLGKHMVSCAIAEGLFVLSILLGYLTLGSLAGSQNAGEYDVYRPATRLLSFLSIVSYLLGLLLFIGVVFMASWPS